MKMVKGLLLGGTACLLAASAAQAADLPVKARAVQYVKICSLYGAGFYYVPGTDTCIKVGGWVRTYTTYGTNGNSTNGGLIDNLNNRSTNNYEFKARGYITADAREQTEYGTVRGYLDVGFSSEYVGGTNMYPGAAGGSTFSSNRAFIQWAGFTAGVAQSFFDFYSGPATSYWGGRINPSEDTGDGGAFTMAYTAQFGGGLSATIAAEAPRTLGTWNSAITTATSTINGIATGTAFAGTGTGGVNTPDIVGNLRIDQAWGSAQLMGAAHDVRGAYYGATAATALDTTGSPGDKWGYALGAGIKLNAPMIGKGDYLQAEVNYAVGASGYIIAGNNARYDKYNSDTSYGMGATFDGIYGAAGTGISLQTGWGVNAAYEHFWNPAWRTSVYGGYEKFTMDSTGNALICANAGVAAAACGSAGNWGVWNIGTRTQWNITKNFFLGVDVVYQHLDTMFSDTPVAIAATGTRPGIAAGTLSNQDDWMVNFRVHRDFYP